jgi:hypothetical protein
MKRLATICILLGVASPAPSTCGLAAVCADVESSFTITHTSEGIRASWSTDEENGVSHYKLSRRNCDLQQCVVPVALVYPAGSCNTEKDYAYTDDPEDPETWTYRIEVFGNGASVPACSYEAELP